MEKICDDVAQFDKSTGYKTPQGSLPGPPMTARKAAGSVPSPSPPQAKPPSVEIPSPRPAVERPRHATMCALSPHESCRAKLGACFKKEQ